MNEIQSIVVCSNNRFHSVDDKFSNWTVNIQLSISLSVWAVRTNVVVSFVYSSIDTKTWAIRFLFFSSPSGYSRLFSCSVSGRRDTHTHIIKPFRSFSFSLAFEWEETFVTMILLRKKKSRMMSEYRSRWACSIHRLSLWMNTAGSSNEYQINDLTIDTNDDSSRRRRTTIRSKEEKYVKNGKSFQVETWWVNSKLMTIKKRRCVLFL